MSEKVYKILVINPGSTSTKVSLFENDQNVFERSVFHEASVLLQFPHVNLQMDFRYNIIKDMCKDEGIDLESIDAFVGRGGSACTQPGGITEIDQKLYDDTEAAVGGSEHPAKLGVMLAWRFACEYNKPAYTLNPTNMDEFCDYARLTGIKGVYRVAHSHVLNQKAVAEFHCEHNGMDYNNCNLIVAHIDGGITVAAHDHGKMIDGNMGADGDGAFSPTRIGSVPVPALLEYMDSHSEDEVKLMCSRAGGFVSLLGTSNADIVHAQVDEGDPKATLVWNTMIYQVCKMIGEMSAVLSGKVDGILLTGGLMRFDDVLAGIQERCGWIAPISVYPGEMEQEALAYPALKVLKGKLTPLKYTGKDVWQGFADIGL